MEWIFSFIGFIAAICTIYSTIFGVPLIISRKIKSAPPQDLNVPPKPIYWPDRMKIWADGLDRIAQALMNSRIIQPLIEDQLQEASISKLNGVAWPSNIDDEQLKALVNNYQQKQEDSLREQATGWIAVSYGCGLLIVGFFLAVVLTLLLFIHNVFTMILAVMCFLLFLTVFLPYIYQVGRRIEEVQQEPLQQHFNQPEITQ